MKYLILLCPYVKYGLKQKSLCCGKLWCFFSQLAGNFVSMALLLPVPGRVGRVNSSAFSLRPRKVNTFATLSPPRSDGANWVEATSSFFEQDKRPIMLFDGNQTQSSFILRIPSHYTKQTTLQRNCLVNFFACVVMQGYATCVMGV